MRIRWGARRERVLEGEVARPQSWREPQRGDERGEQQQRQRLREVRDRVVDGTTEMGRGGGAEDLVRVHPRVDGLNEQDGDGHEAEKDTEEGTAPVFVHRL